MAAKVSIVFAYYNRPELLARTLAAYAELEGDNPDLEFVVVDDGSDEGYRALPVVERFSDRLDLKHILRPPVDINPAVAYNMGIKKATGNMVFLANPEALPLFPIATAMQKYYPLKNQWLIVPCYSVSKVRQAHLETIDYNESGFVNKVLNNIDFNARPATYNGDNAWYEHPLYNPRGLYFTAGMSDVDWEEFGGLDADFKNGWAKEDTDLMRRMKIRGTEWIWLNGGFVLHQYHYDDVAYKKAIDIRAAIQINDRVYAEKEKAGNWKANERG